MEVLGLAFVYVTASKDKPTVHYYYLSWLHDDWFKGALFLFLQFIIKPFWRSFTFLCHLVSLCLLLTAQTLYEDKGNTLGLSRNLYRFPFHSVYR